MPPKKAARSSTLYVVTTAGGLIDSIHASQASAEARVSPAELEGMIDVDVKTFELVGGSINITEAAKPKATKAKKAEKVEKEDDEDEENEPPAKAKPAAKKTKSAAEQLAESKEKGTGKGKKSDVDLPDNVKALLAGSGSALKGKTVVVTGVPPTIGRKTAETLVQQYGGKLTKSLSKNTNYVVIGGDAGPKKLEQIEELNVKTMDEDELIAMLEAGGSSGKRGASDEDDDEEEEEEEKPKKKPTKKQKK